jgi:hypothetical protein
MVELLPAPQEGGTESELLELTQPLQHPQSSGANWGRPWRAVKETLPPSPPQTPAVIPVINTFPASDI